MYFNNQNINKTYLSFSMSESLRFSRKKTSMTDNETIKP